MSALSGVGSGAVAASGSAKTAPAASAVDALSMSRLESLLSRMFGPAQIEFFRFDPKATYMWALSTTGKPVLLEVFRDRIRALGNPVCNPRLRVRQGTKLFSAILQVIVTASRLSVGRRRW